LKVTNKFYQDKKPSNPKTNRFICLNSPAGNSLEAVSGDRIGEFSIIKQKVSRTEGHKTIKLSTCIIRAKEEFAAVCPHKNSI